MKWILIFQTLVVCFLYAKPLHVDVHAKSAVLMNAKSGVVLFEKNPHAQSFPASCTKVATVLYAIDVKKPELSKLVEVSGECIRVKPAGRDFSKYPPYWLEADGTKLGLKKGERISVESLLYGMLLPSGNDAANVLAESMSGTVLKFVDEMNHYFKSIGCQNTHFANPHGLHHADHYTSAYDLCLIGKKAMEFDLFREIVSKVTYKKPHTNFQPEEQFRQHNRLLIPGRFFYSKAIGIKTGYTSQAQNTLIAAAESDGRTLIAVVFGCEKNADRYTDVKNLFEAAFNESKIHQVLLKAGESFSRTIDGATSTLHANLSREMAIDYFPAEEPDHPKAQIHWKIPPLPIHPGDVVGDLQLTDAKGRMLASMPLLAKEEVTGSWSYTLNGWWNRLFHSQ